MKVFTAILAVVLGLCVVATAPSSADVPKPRGPQGLPGPGPVSPPVAQSPDIVPSAEVPPPRGPQGLPGPGPVSPPPVAEPRDVVLPASDGGPSAFAIMLLSVGGILTLTGVGYVVTRAAQHRRAVS